MTEQPKSWSDLDRQHPSQPKEDRFAILCAQVFTQPSGRELLAELRRKYIDRPMNPLADERALRVLAAEQHFVRELELARDRGVKAKS